MLSREFLSSRGAVERISPPCYDQERRKGGVDGQDDPVHRSPENTGSRGRSELRLRGPRGDRGRGIGKVRGPHANGTQLERDLRAGPREGPRPKRPQRRLATPAEAVRWILPQTRHRYPGSCSSPSTPKGRTRARLASASSAFRTASCYPSFLRERRP